MTIVELARALEEKRVSSIEATQDALARIDAAQSRFNAFITIDRDGAMKAARDADASLARGDNGPLTGIPIAHKDVLMTAALKTTCGSRMLANFVAPYDAFVVERLKSAGMVCVGKTNMDEFAMGSSTETSCFGPARNPWDARCVAGGSSGGSAVAVAAQLVPAATGTDTGGSIRQPAALAGVCGLKPTYGLCSRYGLVAFASSLDHPGPFARSAEDCALLLTAMAGHDPRDATSVERAPEDYTRLLRADRGAKPLDGVRVGWPQEYRGEGIDEEVAAAIETAIGELVKLGATIKTISLPAVRHSIPVYYVIAPAEASSNLSRFDGVRYGHRSEHYDDLTDMYKRTRAEGFGAEVKRRILVGTYVLSHGYYDAYYLKAQKVRRLIADDFRSAYRDCDVVVGPTSPSAAFEIGAKADDPVQMYLNDIFTVAGNLTGAPAISIPCGMTRSGLPIGLQIQGDHFAEATILDIAHRYQQATDWHQRIPPAEASTR